MSLSSRRHVLQGAFLGVACACAGARIAYAADTTSPTGKWTCPPCGCPNDGKEFDAAGVCSAPGCGMDLVPVPKPAPKGGAFLSGGSR